MPIAPSARIHPTAVIDPLADIADGVTVGPYAVIDGPVAIGADCTIRAHATLVGPMTMGRANDVGVSVVLGERPQHLGFNGNDVTRTQIGDGNTFRESVTVHRGTSTGVTIIGNSNYLMVNCHVGHDCRLGNNITIANGALLAGHCELQDRVFVSGNSSLHQFARIGRLAFLSGNSASTRDILPFMTLAERDQIVGINKVGMQRAGHTSEDITIVRMAYRILFRDRMVQKLAIERLEKELGHHPLIAEILQFVAGTKRGFVGGHHLFAHHHVDSEAA